MEARLRLYGRTYCHLCEDMAASLAGLQRELAFCLEIVDVDTDAALEERFGELVPVLTDAGGEEICHYFLDEAALRQRVAVR